LYKSATDTKTSALYKSGHWQVYKTEITTVEEVHFPNNGTAASDILVDAQVSNLAWAQPSDHLSILVAAETCMSERGSHHTKDVN